MRVFRTVGSVLVAGVLSTASMTRAEDLGTAFTFQGQLMEAGAPATGLQDFCFTLYDAADGGSQVGDIECKDDVTVERGLFTLVLDFGSGAFEGDARWLEVAVRPGGSKDDYTILSPRQEMTPAPYSIYAPSAGSTPWTGLTGVPPGFADKVDDTHTLDEAYDEGGPGAGRTITADAGPVNIAGAYGLTVAGTITSGSSITIEGTPGSENIRSTDDLELHVYSGRALRLKSDPTSPNLIGGFSGNSVTASVSGATIGGGGANASTNRVTDNYGTIGGGRNNQAGDDAGTVSDKEFATVGGGVNNTASELRSAVGGGAGNTASAFESTVSGGGSNTASGNASTVGGGDSNTASGQDSTVGGGVSNIANGRRRCVGGITSPSTANRLVRCSMPCSKNTQTRALRASRV